MLRYLFIKSLILLYRIGYRHFKFRNREAVWKAHRWHPFKQQTLIGKEPRIKKITRMTYFKLMAVKDIRNGVVLDAGCSTSPIGKKLVNRGCAVYGIDVNPDAVAIAKYFGVFASVCPVEELTFQDNFFDYCLAFELLEHLYNPEDGLRELQRVLRPGGKLIGSSPYPYGKFSVASKFQSFWHHQDFTPESLKALLEKFFKPKSIDIKRRNVYSDMKGCMMVFTGIK